MADLYQSVQMEVDNLEPTREVNEYRNIQGDPPIASWLSKPKMKSGYLTCISLKTVIIIPWNLDIIKEAVVSSWLSECRTYTIKRISTGVSAAELVFSSTDIGDVALLDLKLHLDKMGIEVTHPNIYQQQVRQSSRRGGEFRYRNEYDDVVGVTHRKEFFTRVVIVERLPSYWNTEERLSAVFPEAENVVCYEYDVNATGIAILEFESESAVNDFMEAKGPEMNLSDDVRIELYRYTERARDYHKYQSYINKVERAQINKDLTPLEDYERLQLNAEMNELRNEYKVIHNRGDILGAAKLSRIQEIDGRINQLTGMIKHDTGRRKKEKLGVPEQEDEMQTYTKVTLGLGKGEETLDGDKESYKEKEETDQLKSLREMEKQLKTLQKEYYSINSKIHNMENYLTPEQHPQQESFYVFRKYLHVRDTAEEIKKVPKMKDEIHEKIGISVMDLEPEELRQKISRDNIDEIKAAINYETQKLNKELEGLKETHSRLKNKHATTRLFSVVEEKKKMALIPSLMNIQVQGRDDEQPTSLNQPMEIAMQEHNLGGQATEPMKVEPELNYKVLFLTGFGDFPTVKNDLHQLFTRAIHIETNEVGKKKRFAFATYRTEEECKIDFELNQGKILNGTPLIVTYRRMQSQPTAKPKILLIKGFSNGHGNIHKLQKQLQQLCRRSKDVRVRNTPGMQIAVAKYTTAEDCQMDRDELQGKQLDGHPLKVELYKRKTVKNVQDKMDALNEVEVPSVFQDTLRKTMSNPFVSSQRQSMDQISPSNPFDRNQHAQGYNMPEQHSQQFNVPDHFRQSSSVYEQKNQMRAMSERHSQQYNMPGLHSQEFNMPDMQGSRDRSYQPGDDQGTQSSKEVQKLFKGITDVLTSKIREIESQGEDNMSGNLDLLGSQIFQSMGQIMQGAKEGDLGSQCDQFQQQIKAAIGQAQGDSAYNTRNQNQ